jgi:hypothetical protein
VLLVVVMALFSACAHAVPIAATPAVTLPIRALTLDVIRGCDAEPGCANPCQMPAVGYEIRYNGCRWEAYAPGWTGRQ